MGIFGNPGKGIRTAMQKSYSKHVHLHLSSRTEEGSAHTSGLFGALATRNKVNGYPDSEVDIWIELMPFIELEEERATEALFTYAVFREVPETLPRSEASMLITTINNGLMRYAAVHGPTICLNVPRKFRWVSTITDETWSRIRSLPDNMASQEEQENSTKKCPVDELFSVMTFRMENAEMGPIDLRLEAFFATEEERIIEMMAFLLPLVMGAIYSSDNIGEDCDLLFLKRVYGSQIVADFREAFDEKTRCYRDAYRTSNVNAKSLQNVMEEYAYEFTRSFRKSCDSRTREYFAGIIGANLCFFYSALLKKLA